MAFILPSLSYARVYTVASYEAKEDMFISKDTVFPFTASAVFVRVISVAKNVAALLSHSLPKSLEVFFAITFQYYLVPDVRPERRKMLLCTSSFATMELSLKEASVATTT